MKKIIIKCIVNLIGILIVLALVESYLYHNACETLSSTWGKSSYRPPYGFIMRQFDEIYEDCKTKIMREPEGLNYKKKPIVVFGCSFAYGEHLNNNQTLSYKLSHLARRPIYNRAVGGWGIQHMLYQSRRNDFYEEVKEPEYIIYVFIGAQVSRLYRHVSWMPSNDLYLRYKEKKGKLTEIKTFWSRFWFLYIIKTYFENFEEKQLMKDEYKNKNFDVVKLHFIESKEELQKRYPRARFVILKYVENQDSWYLNNSRWKELENEGFIILDTKSLTGKDVFDNKYRFPDSHPTEAAWNLVAPALVKKLNL